MIVSLALLFLILAFVCALIAAGNVNWGGRMPNWLAMAFALFLLSILVGPTYFR